MSVKLPHNNPHHDRLDLKLHTDHYTAPECGSIDLSTGKPTYCDFDCPMIALRGTPDHPTPHWITDPEKVAMREQDLAKLGLQPADKLVDLSQTPKLMTLPAK